MTQTNGISATGDRRSEASAASHQQQLNGMEPEKAEEEEADRTASRAVTAAVTAPDGGWGWVVLIATILVLALTLAFPSCVGIFYTDLQDDFQATNSETSWVPSIMTSALHAGGLLSAPRWNQRATF